MAKKLTVYQRLVRAAKRGGCLRLSANDVWQLGRMDDAISCRAEQDDEEDETTRLVKWLGGNLSPTHRLKQPRSNRSD